MRGHLPVICCLPHARERVGAGEPLDVERFVRRVLAIVDQTTPLSVGEPLVQLILARLHESDR